MKRKVSLLVSLLAAGSLAPSADAGLMLYQDRASWIAAVGPYSQVNIAGQVGEFDLLSAGAPLWLPSGGSLVFDRDLEGLQVPDSWTTWSSGATPRVLYSGVDGYSVTTTFSTPAAAFGLEFQPDPFFAPAVMRLDLDGVTVFDGEVGGDAGAQFLGWMVVNGDPAVNKWVLSGEYEFAFGRMLEPGGIPSPDAGATLGYLVGAMAGLFCWARLGRRTT